MGAIFIDGGIKEVLRVYEHLLSPFILFVAKYSKKLNKEPKEDFIIQSGENNIKPQFKSKGQKRVNVSQLLGINH